MRTNSQGFVDVRFFGAHDRAWVPFKECFLYSLKDPNSSKVKRNDIIESIKVLYIQTLFIFFKILSRYFLLGTECSHREFKKNVW